jgi:hypothetical protein
MATAIARETAEKLAEKLRNELAGVTGIYHALKAANLSPDDMFWSYKEYKDGTQVERGILNKIWYFNPAGESYLLGPGVDHHLFIATKYAWKYPWGGVFAKLPKLPVAGDFWFFGFEPSPGGMFGLIGVRLTQNYFTLRCDGTTFWNAAPLLPTDYYTAYHTYAIKVNKPNAEFYIDNALIGVAIRAGINFNPISGPPYIIFGSTMKGFDESTAFIEFWETDVEKYYLGPSNFRVMSGDPLPPRGYPLYLTETNTKLAGYSVSSGSVTSHPVPVFGYPGKTLYFMANQAGTLLIEVLTQSGNWRTYDSDTVSAGTLWWYKMTGDAVLARLTFTPTTYPCTISDAEAVLNG